MYFDERMKIGDEKENPSGKGLFRDAEKKERWIPSQQ